MSRNSYDDMLPEGYRGGRRGSGRTTAVIACIGVLLTLMAIFIYLLFSPSGEGDEPEAHRVDPVAAAPAEVSIIETDQDAALIEARPAPSVIEKASEDMAKAEFMQYTAAEGDTVSSIAEGFGLESSTIVSVNRMRNTGIEAGDVLEIPPMDGFLYTVAEGDTLESIASSYNPDLSAADLAAINGLAYTVADPGDVLFIPQPGAVDSGDGYLFSSPLPGGRMTARFGELRDGESIDGIVISSDPGSAVIAAGDGSVIDIIANDPRYGRAVRIMHSDGYSTGYYGLETVRVHTSQSIGAGDVIGSIGTSSLIFDEPAVLFTVEQNGVKLDPVYLTDL